MFTYIAKLKKEVVLDNEFESYLKNNNIKVEKRFEKLDLILIKSPDKISIQNFDCFEILEIEKTNFSI